MSHDVTALFTSVHKALEVITEKLQDDTLTSCTEMTIPQIIELLDFCLNTTYLIYNEAYYQQTHGAAMGSPISPLVANCYMEQFEKVAISTAPHPPPIIVVTIRGRHIPRTSRIRRGRVHWTCMWFHLLLEGSKQCVNAPTTISQIAYVIGSFRWGVHINNNGHELTSNANFIIRIMRTFQSVKNT